MDVKRKEMDLLSNSIAAFAHIKGQFLRSNMFLYQIVYNFSSQKSIGTGFHSQ